MAKKETAETEPKTLDFNERRTQALAKENAQLRAYISTMMTRLQDNDDLFSKLFSIETSVLAATDPEDMCFTLLRELRSQFSLDLVRFWFDKDSLIGNTQMSALSDQDLIWIEAGEINAMGLNRRNVWLLQMQKDGFPWMQPRDESLESIALLRLGTQERPFGVLGLGSNDQERFTPDQSTDFLAHLAQIISLSLEHSITHQRLARLAITDSLTGVQNRRFLQPYSHQPLSSWFGKGLPVAALFFDLDNLKDMNDRLGHDAGDDALNQLCDIIRGFVRAQDPLIRMGGDEFTLLLPGCEEKKSLDIAHKILKKVGKAVCKGEPLSVSIGAAISSADEDLTLNKLIKNADKAMYVAKALGGNRLEIAQAKPAE